MTVRSLVGLLAVLMAVVVMAVMLSGCKVTSIDGVKNKKLDLCQQIHDEQLRVNCIQGVK